MNTNSVSVRSRRPLLLLAVLGLGLALWVTEDQRLRARRSALDAQAAELARVQELASAEREAADRLRQQLDAERQAAAGVSMRGAAGADPTGDLLSETRWNRPPASLPDWNRASPFVWIPKMLLPEIPIAPFNDAGSLQRGLGALLVLDPERERTLNQEMSRLVAEVRKAEAASAMLAPNPLPGIAAQSGDKLTLEVPGQTEASLRLRSEVESTLRTALGESRSELVLHWGKTWLDEQFGSSEAQPKIYSVVRHPDQTYGLNIKTGGSEMSVGDVSSFMDYIPPHLRNWFEPLETPSATAGAGRP